METGDRFRGASVNRRLAKPAAPRTSKCPEGTAQQTLPDQRSGQAPAVDGSQADNRLEEAEWHRVFLKRSDMAFIGRYQPTVHELILRMALFRDSVSADCRMFTQQLIARLVHDDLDETVDIDRLRAVLVSPTGETFLAVAFDLAEAWKRHAAPELSYLAEASARFDYYAALSDSATGAFRVAGLALICALDENYPNCARLQFYEAAQGWLLRAATELPGLLGRLQIPAAGTSEGYATEWGPEIVRLGPLLGAS